MATVPPGAVRWKLGGTASGTVECVHMDAMVARWKVDVLHRRGARFRFSYLAAAVSRRHCRTIDALGSHRGGRTNDCARRQIPDHGGREPGIFDLAPR